MLNTLDWSFIFLYLFGSLLIGIIVSKKAGKDTTSYFAAGKDMPWWLLGVSMVATTFAADTPNLVTNIVRENGVSGNWLWWSFLLTGMLTVFVYSRLWKRSGVLTDVEFYEIRYSGRPAAFLRGFRAVYLGLLFNVVIMATVSLAAIKFASILIGWSPAQTLLIAGSITLVYSLLGGLRGVLLTDFFQFILALTGAVIAAWVAVNLPETGGLRAMLSHESLQGKLSLLPDPSDTSLLWSVLLIPIMVQWWSVYYPGAEPGGGGYVAQRMLAAKDENNALSAVFLFNVAHYALRPWPWIVVALASLIVFPDLEAMRQAFPGSEAILDEDLAYPAMLTFIPNGLLGIVVASIVAAYMSTISTHLNWGASYIVNDVYRRFVKPESSETHLVWIGRLTTLVLMILATVVALFMQSALDSFQILLQIGAGTGLIFILRWFWWRINAWSEITAMVVSFAVALYFGFVHSSTGMPAIDGTTQLLIGIAVTTVAWLAVTFATRPTEMKTLADFNRLVRPGGPGWQVVREYQAEMAQQGGRGAEEATAIPAATPAAMGAEEPARWNLPMGILAMMLGCVTVYSLLFATGYWIYGWTGPAIGMTLLAVVAGWALSVAWRRLLKG